MNRPPRSIQNDLAAKTRLGAIELLNPACGRRVMEVHQLRYPATEAAATTPVRVDRDQQLVEALRLREPTAAERLVATYGDRAYRLAIGITGNRPDAEEAVQDAFWNVVRKIDTFRGDSSLGSWVYRITANAAYQKLRGGARRRDDISLDEVLPSFHEDGRHVEPISDWSASIDDPAVQAELRAALDSALGELPAHYRAVIVLHDVEGLSMAETASAMGITVATAKTRGHRARLFLRKRLAIFMSGETASTAPSSKEQRCPWPRLKALNRVDGLLWKVEAHAQD